PTACSQTRRSCPVPLPGSWSRWCWALPWRWEAPGPCELQRGARLGARPWREPCPSASSRVRALQTRGVGCSFVTWFIGRFAKDALAPGWPSRMEVRAMDGRARIALRDGPRVAHRERSRAVPFAQDRTSSVRGRERDRRAPRALVDGYEDPL